MKLTTKFLEIDSLNLDPINPRFIISPNANQESIINYLLEYEGVLSLAQSINEFGGLMPGERIIVYELNGKYIVLEGNRRVCACKLLLNSSLIPPKFIDRFPSANAETIKNLEALNIDVVKDRESAQSTLYHRHIKGVKRWSTISKQKFFASEFRSKKTIEEIAHNTSTTQSDVKKGIKEYNLIEYMMELDNWKSDEKERLNLQDLKLSPFLRVFSSKSKIYEQNASKLLRMEYDQKSLKPVSSLKKGVFDRAIYLIAKAAFFDNEFNTRNHIEDIQQLVEHLTKHRILDIEFEEQTNISDGINTGDIDYLKGNVANQNNESTSQHSELDDKKGPSEHNIFNSPNKPHSNDNKIQKSPKTSLFFNSLTWNGLSPHNPDHVGIIHISDEIRRLSVNNMYGRYPIATAMLLRSLLEQSLKYYTKHIGEWNNLIIYSGKKPGFDPMLKDIIRFYKSKNNYLKFFKERTIQSAYNCATESSILDFLDTNVHNTQIIRATKTELDNIASKGLFPVINFILNVVINEEIKSGQN